MVCPIIFIFNNIICFIIIILSDRFITNTPFFYSIMKNVMQILLIIYPQTFAWKQKQNKNNANFDASLSKILVLQLSEK